MAEKYAVDASIGRVTSSSRKITTVEVDAHVPMAFDMDSWDEIHLIVNGHVVKRMNIYQAQRLGILPIEGR